MSSDLTQSRSLTTTTDDKPLIRFHMSLNVSNLDASVQFFRVFFGCDPAKLRSDYAKFEVEQPALVLSLEPSRPSGTGVLNHVGIRMPDTESLVAMQRRLETHGVSTRREDGIECCYAKQTKFWLHDPDGTLWEVYTLDEDIDHHGYSPSDAPSVTTIEDQEARPTSDVSSAPAIWSHRIGQPFPSKLFVQPCSVDEIRLQGTFNMMCDAGQRSLLLGECARALSTDGKVVLHQLTSDKVIAPDQLELSVAASVVQQVIPIDQLVRELESAGLNDIQFDKYAERPCFIRQAIELRETLLTVRRQAVDTAVDGASESSAFTHRVFLKGPLKELLAGETRLRQGTFTFVTRQLAEQLLATLGEAVIVTPRPTC